MRPLASVGKKFTMVGLEGMKGVQITRQNAPLGSEKMGGRLGHLMQIRGRQSRQAWITVRGVICSGDIGVRRRECS